LPPAATISSATESAFATSRPVRNSLALSRAKDRATAPRSRPRLRRSVRSCPQAGCSSSIRWSGSVGALLRDTGGGEDGTAGSRKGARTGRPFDRPAVGRRRLLRAAGPRRGLVDPDRERRRGPRCEVGREDDELLAGLVARQMHLVGAGRERRPRAVGDAVGAGFVVVARDRAAKDDVHVLAGMAVPAEGRPRRRDDPLGDELDVALGLQGFLGWS
jgi:hypothetical protein